MDSIPAMTASAAQFGDQLAVIDGDSRLTYGDLIDAARQFGAALVACGVAAGDRVAIWCFNSVEWIVAALGLWEAGAVLVPVNTRFKGAEAADMIERLTLYMNRVRQASITREIIEVVSGAAAAG